VFYGAGTGGKKTRGKLSRTLVGRGHDGAKTSEETRIPHEAPRKSSVRKEKEKKNPYIRGPEEKNKKCVARNNKRGSNRSLDTRGSRVPLGI